MPWYSLNVSRHIVAVVFSVHCGGSCIWLPMNSWFILFLCPIIFLIICYFSLTLMLSSAGPDSNLVTLSCIFFNLFLISAATLSNNRITWKREAGIFSLHNVISTLLHLPMPVFRLRRLFLKNVRGHWFLRRRQPIWKVSFPIFKNKTFTGFFPCGGTNNYPYNSPAVIFRVAVTS